ncbi:MAG: hypothetical protein KDA44_11430 [Planctomycetales bacterium]|nr:hypothetical protein [Planctomycetales bacterium]
MSFSTRSLRCVQYALCLAALALPVAARAADPLVWKFTAGDVQHYKMSQNMEMQIPMPGGQQVNVNVNQDLHMTWNVLEVLEDGSAKLTQKIERMKMTMKNSGQTMEFDSANPDASKGPLADALAPVFKALTSAEFEVTMTPQGKITEVEIPDDLITSLKSSPGAEMMGELASKDGLQHLVQQGALTLPEDLTEGKEWTTKVEMKNPMVGTQTIVTTYRYEGPRDVDGETLEVISPTLDVKFGEGAQVEIVGQESSGEILFNRKAGRLQKSSIKQGMDLKMSVGGQESNLKVDQTITLTWVSPEDAAAEKAK